MSWRSATIAADGTHHRVGDEPLYEQRFDEVLKFHEPGLAPVRRGDEAWHIRADGTAAYSRRFERTFGFYDGLAAVVSAQNIPQPRHCLSHRCRPNHRKGTFFTFRFGY